MKLCVTTTATCRPEILEQTYESFTKRIADIRLNKVPLFINIDPAIDPSLREPTLKVAKRYFKTVHPILPDVPNFSKAVKSVWSSVKGFDLVLHLEDDWKLVAFVKYKDIEKRFRDHPKLIQVKFRRPKAASVELSAFSLLPSIYRANFCYEFSQEINTQINPEVELHEYQRRRKLGKGAISVYCPNARYNIIDIGRKWRQQHNIQKHGIKKDFVRWAQIS